MDTVRSRIVVKDVVAEKNMPSARSCRPSSDAMFQLWELEGVEIMPNAWQTLPMPSWRRHSEFEMSSLNYPFRFLRCGARECISGFRRL